MIEQIKELDRKIDKMISDYDEFLLDFIEVLSEPYENLYKRIDKYLEDSKKYIEEFDKSVRKAGKEFNDICKIISEKDIEEKLLLKLIRIGDINFVLQNRVSSQIAVKAVLVKEYFEGSSAFDINTNTIDSEINSILDDLGIRKQNDDEVNEKLFKYYHYFEEKLCFKFENCLFFHIYTLVDVNSNQLNFISTQSFKELIKLADDNLLSVQLITLNYQIINFTDSLIEELKEVHKKINPFL